MKRVVSFLVIIILGFIFTGCSSPTVKVVETTKRYYTPIPKTMLTIPVTPRPVSRQTYIDAGIIEREKINTDLIIELYMTIHMYKNKILKIRDYDNGIKEIVKKENLK